MLQFDQILEIVKSACRNGNPVADENATPKIIKIDAADLKMVSQALYQHPSTYFDMLSCITGVDNGPTAGTMEVFYHLYSIPFNHHVGLKVLISRQDPAVDSVNDVWKTANWHERELFDMYGINVKNHPDLRRILMPADWQGFPLRKDYKQDELYRNIKIEY